jgi:hypothetical protein
MMFWMREVLLLLWIAKVVLRLSVGMRCISHSICFSFLASYIAVASAEYINVCAANLLLDVLHAFFAELKHFRVENVIIQMFPGDKTPFDFGVDDAILQSVTS